MTWNPQFICLVLQSEIGVLPIIFAWFGIDALPEIDPSNAAQSCDHKTRNNDMVWISAHKFSPSQIKISIR